MSESPLVLVVEQEPELRADLVHGFTMMGCRVKAASDENEAIAFLARSDEIPALACVDLSLPRGSGYDVCDYLRATKRLERVQILVLSDHASPEDMAYAEEAGANAFLRIPFPIERLAQYVEPLFGGEPPTRSTVRWLRPSDLPPPGNDFGR